MKFKGVIIWMVVFLAACVALHHICVSITVQLEQVRAQHTHQLEEQSDVR